MNTATKSASGLKSFKRNAVIITVLLFVCAAVYLNWSYASQVEDASEAGLSAGADTTDVPEGDTSAGQETASAQDGEVYGDEGAGLFYTEDTEAASDTASDYFAQVRLERQQARDEASSTLQTVATTEGAAQETVDSALEGMTQIAQWTVKEAELENLIRAKGFDDCVVYLSESGATVTVSAPDGLSEAAVARITDIIVTETEFSADQLRVIEIK